jgi:DNA-binding NtrC family response regulator
MILEEMAEILTDEGYECFVASSVEDAVEIVKTAPGIILILTDMKMPKATGADLIKIVETKLGKTIKFIVMSGHANPEVETNGIDIALYPFLRKPLDIVNMIEKIASVLEKTEKQL